MIVLDTNVVSELIRTDCNEVVRNWLSRQQPKRLAITVITLFEIQYGRNLLQKSARRAKLDGIIQEIVSREAFGRLLSFGPAASELGADICARRRTMGREVDTSDCMIAGIVLEHGATLATRNIKDFDGVGLSLVNPWEFIS